MGVPGWGPCTQPFPRSCALPVVVLPSELLPDFPRLCLRDASHPSQLCLSFLFVPHQGEKKSAAGLLAAANTAQLLLGWVAAPAPSRILSRDGCRRRMSPPRQLQALEKCPSRVL